jgi:hypothetical protein
MLAYPTDGASVAVRSSRPRRYRIIREPRVLKFPRGTFCGTNWPTERSQVRRLQNYECPFLVSFWSFWLSRPFRRDRVIRLPDRPLSCQMTTELASREILGSSNHSVLPAVVPSVGLPAPPWSAPRPIVANDVIVPPASGWTIAAVLFR